MTLEKLIGELISMIQNDLMITDNYVKENDITDSVLEDWNYEEVNKAFVYLQIELTRYLIGHEYCSNKECVCAPLPSIRSLLQSRRDIYEKHLYKYQLDWLIEEFEEEA